MRLLFVTFLGLCVAGCGAGAASGAFGGAGGAGAAGGGATTTSSIAFTTSTGSGAGGSGEGGATTTTTYSSTSSSSASSSTGTWSSSSSGGTDGGAVKGSGDCASDADCPGGRCAPITPGGFRVCVIPPAEATSCTSDLDQCCPGKQSCTDGAPCYEGPLVPVCTGTPTVTHNVCGVDQCAKDVDCASGQICAPAGSLGLEIRACVSAFCKVDTDCTAHAGGICAPVQAPCCAAPAGLFCVYPGYDGCRKNADCAAAQTYCAPDAATGVSSCQSGSPVCPA